ncbi:hypothetical protein [Nocardioides convexus]|uniref:oxidoreductase n=1 Tax=Nocardioides convexus TaxID=2712224 RepID=UPI003100E15C
MAHSYLISSFLAPGLNRRRDRWGGPLERRARLARQVARVVREEVGDAVAVTAKVSVSDGFTGGVTTPMGIEPGAACWRPTGTSTRSRLSGGSSLMNPMYLFRGEGSRRGVRRDHAAARAVGDADPGRARLPQALRVRGGVLPPEGDGACARPWTCRSCCSAGSTGSARCSRRWPTASTSW